MKTTIKRDAQGRFISTKKACAVKPAKKTTKAKASKTTKCECCSEKPAKKTVKKTAAKKTTAKKSAKKA